VSSSINGQLLDHAAPDHVERDDEMAAGQL